MAFLNKPLNYLKTPFLAQCIKSFPLNIKNFHLSHCVELPKVVPFNLSDIGEGIKEVVVKEWFIKEGDKVNQFDNICEVQSDKASVTITSRYDGIVKKLHYDIEHMALVGKPLVDIEIEEELGSQEEKGTEIPNNTELNRKDETQKEMKSCEYQNYSTVQCIPSVRRLAKQYQLDLNKIIGTGKRGRILKEDIINYFKRVNPKVVAEINGIQDEDLHEVSKSLTGFQKPMFRNMTASLTIPHFILCDEISINKLTSLRKEINTNENIETKLSFLPFFIKAVSLGLLRYPILNSSLDEKEENILYKNNHNIGIAMDTKIGLAVPVIKNAEKMSILSIASELNRIKTSGKQGTFSTTDLQDPTFTVSNIGTIGGTYACPIISKPQVAIIALGASKIVPKFDKEMKVIPDNIVNVSAAADHRIIDGATMANFINFIKTNIENPYSLLLK